MALRFYLRQVIANCSRPWISMSRGTTNYAALLSRVERWRKTQEKSASGVNLVTFNYDDLLEEALRGLGQGFGHIDDYVFTEPYGVFKLHGSTNWERAVRLKAGPGPEYLIGEAARLVLTDEYFVLGSQLDSAAIPAVAVPTLSKTTFECPASHVEALVRAMKEVDRILVIGWKGREETFTNLLRENLRPGGVGLVVSSELGSVSDVANLLSAAIPKASFEGADLAGFSGLVGSPDTLDLFLGG